MSTSELLSDCTYAASRRTGMYALLCIMLLTSFLFSQQKTSATNTEKLFFSENETFQNPLPLSPRIQKLILETKEAKDAWLTRPIQIVVIPKGGSLLPKYILVERMKQILS